MSPSLLDQNAAKLANDPYQKNVLECRTNMVVEAGPGTGKTELLTTKMAILLRDEISEPRGALCITYSNECARELSRRLRVLGIRPRRNLFVGTIHAWCLVNIIVPFHELAGIPLPRDFRIAQAEEHEDLLRQCWREIVGGNPTNSNLVGITRSRAIDPLRCGVLSDDSRNARIMREYEEKLQERGLIDFGQMVEWSAKILADHPQLARVIAARYQWILIDEYQDLGLGLHLIVRELAKQPSTTVAVFGDPKQSIYGFTGARPELMAELYQDAGFQHLPLVTNYRSKEEITARARTHTGTDYEVSHHQGGGGRVDHHRIEGGEYQVADFIVGTLLPDLVDRIPIEKVGILYEWGQDGHALVAKLDASGAFPFTRRDKFSPFPRQAPLARWLGTCATWVCDRVQRERGVQFDEVCNEFHLLTAVRWNSDRARADRVAIARALRGIRPDSPLSTMVNSIHDAVVERRVADEPLLGSPGEIASLIGEGFFATNGLQVEDCAREWTGRNALTLSTIHGAKGLEFQAAIIVGLHNLPPVMESGAIEDDDDLNAVAFVAATRAHVELHLIQTA